MENELFSDANSKKLNNQESKTLLVDEGKKIKDEELILSDADVDEFAEEDERFVSEEKQKKEKPFGKKFKDSIRKEQRLSKVLRLKNKLTLGIKSPKWLESFFKFLDFVLNIFVIGTLVTSIVITINFALLGNYFMVAAMCLFIFVIIYLSEKIS